MEGRSLELERREVWTASSWRPRSRMRTEGSTMARNGRPETDDEDQQKRRETIKPLDIDELRREPALERVARAVTELCDVSMAHVSIMEDERQCVLGQIGFDRDHFVRDESFCAYTLAARELMVVEDTGEDERFAENPYVLEAPYIRFYVGFPLEVQGIPVGTLCALDGEPGELTERCRAALSELVRIVEKFLESKLVAASEEDPRYRVASELTSMAALAAMLDARAGDAPRIGEVVGELKGCIDSGHDAVNAWLEEELDGEF